MHPSPGPTSVVDLVSLPRARPWRPSAFSSLDPPWTPVALRGTPQYPGGGLPGEAGWPCFWSDPPQCNLGLGGGAFCCGLPALVGVARSVGLPPVRLAFRFRPWGGASLGGGCRAGGPGGSLLEPAAGPACCLALGFRCRGVACTARPHALDWTTAGPPPGRLIRPAPPPFWGGCSLWHGPSGWTLPGGAAGSGRCGRGCLGLGLPPWCP